MVALRPLPRPRARTPGGPVAIAVSQPARPGRAADLERAIHGVTAAASAFPGFLGGEVFRAPNAADAPTLVLRVESDAAMRRWRESADLRDWTAGVASSADLSRKRVERVTGLEAWFTLLDRASAPPPPKWKTAVTSAVAIYPTILVVPRLLGPVTRGLPGWLSTLVTVAVLIPLMTWVVTPQVARLFRPWLYPSGDARPGRRGGPATTPPPQV